MVRGVSSPASESGAVRGAQLVSGEECMEEGQDGWECFGIAGEEHLSPLHSLLHRLR